MRLAQCLFVEILDKSLRYAHMAKGTCYPTKKSIHIKRILSKFAPVKKSLLFIHLSMLVCTFLYAQQRDELRLISSSHSRLNATTGNMMNYRPVYEHHGSTLSADSGYVYSDDEEKQYFDAFGK